VCGAALAADGFVITTETGALQQTGRYRMQLRNMTGHSGDKYMVSL
jgi:hypothetical protein